MESVFLGYLHFFFLRDRYHSRTILYCQCLNLRSAGFSLSISVVIVWYIPPPDTETGVWRSCFRYVHIYFQGWLKTGGAGVRESVLHAVATKEKKLSRSLWSRRCGHGAVFLRCKKKIPHEKCSAWIWRKRLNEELQHLPPAAFLLAEKSSPSPAGDLVDVSCGRCSEYTWRSKTCWQKKKKKEQFNQSWSRTVWQRSLSS